MNTICSPFHSFPHICYCFLLSSSHARCSPMPLCAPSPQRRRLSGFPIGSGGQCIVRFSLHVSCCSVSFFQLSMSHVLDLNTRNKYLVGRGWTCVALFLSCVEYLQLFLAPASKIVKNGSCENYALHWCWPHSALQWAPETECFSGWDSGHACLGFMCVQKELLRGGFLLFCSPTFICVKKVSWEEVFFMFCS